MYHIYREALPKKLLVSNLWAYDFPRKYEEYKISKLGKCWIEHNIMEDKVKMFIHLWQNKSNKLKMNQKNKNKKITEAKLVEILTAVITEEETNKMKRETNKK